MLKAVTASILRGLNKINDQCDSSNEEFNNDKEIQNLNYLINK